MGIDRVIGEYAVTEGMITQEEVLRTDTAVVETNIHFPVDSSLLWDSCRVLMRLVQIFRQ